ncbi:MAG: hypothetical protein K2P81_01630 [Bacteriovoracaceae bacterium]|nr:hypothetical protein [Bacteriovoracaceae bacterium]
MNYLILISLFLCFSFKSAQPNAIEALRTILTEYEYEGVDPTGERCFLDIVNRPNGDVHLMLDSSMDRDFNLEASAAYELKPGYFKSSMPATVDNAGNRIQKTLIVGGLKVSILRTFTTAERSWTSDIGCLFR